MQAIPVIEEVVNGSYRVRIGYGSYIFPANSASRKEAEEILNEVNMRMKSNAHAAVNG